MSETAETKTPRQLRIHTQFLVAITRVARPIGWAIGDNINLLQTRSGKITIENLTDPEVIAERAKEYADALAEKEELYRAKKEKLAAEAKTKADQKAEAKAAKEAADAEAAKVEAPAEDGEVVPEPDAEANASG